MARTSVKNDDFLAGLGANERAILERVPTRTLRKLAAGVVRIKMRLQFTGWLQYVLPLIPISLLALLSGVALVLDFPRVAAAFGVATGLVVVIALFDVITVKFRIRPPEARPARNDQLDTFDLMRARTSCRSFQNGVISEEDRAELMECVERHTAAPTIGPTPIRLEYIRGGLTVWPTVNGTEFLVAIAPLPYDRRSILDVGRTLQKVVMHATRMGLGTCWIGPGADHDSLKGHLGDRFDPERDQIICTCAVGYRSRFVPLFVRGFNRMFSRRLPLRELFFSDPELSDPIDVDAPPHEQFGRTFEICQWAPSSYNGQTTRAVVRTDETDRVAGVDFYSSTASRYYAPVALGIWCANWELGCEALGIEGRLDPCSPPSGKLEVPRHDVTWVPIRAPHETNGTGSGAGDGD